MWQRTEPVGRGADTPTMSLVHAVVWTQSAKVLQFGAEHVLVHKAYEVVDPPSEKPLVALARKYFLEHPHGLDPRPPKR